MAGTSVGGPASADAKRAFAARAEAGSQWALSALHTRIEAGDLEEARAAADSLAPFWKKIGSQAGLLGTTLHVAAGLGAAGTAAMLLEPFRVETVAPEHAAGLAAAAGQYGQEWTRRVIDGWFGSKHYAVEADRSEWVDRLPGLCGALRAAGAPEVARLLAVGAWGWMADQLRLWTTTARAEIREPHLEMLSSPLVRLLEAADDELRDEIVAALRGYGDNVLRCDSAELPVRHQTRRQGRPYTLVLTKTGELFTREKDARHKAVTDLAWLTSAWGDGPAGMSLVLRVVPTRPGTARSRTWRPWPTADAAGKSEPSAAPCLCPASGMMVLCAPGNDGCPMTSGLSCCLSCSFGTPSWSLRRTRSRPRCWSWKTIRGSPTRSRPSCGRYAPAGRRRVREPRQLRRVS